MVVLCCPSKYHGLWLRVKREKDPLTESETLKRSSHETLVAFSFGSYSTFLFYAQRNDSLIGSFGFVSYLATTATKTTIKATATETELWNS